VTEEHVWSIEEMILRGEVLEGATCPNVTMSTTYATWTGMGQTQALRVRDW